MKLNLNSSSYVWPLAKRAFAAFVIICSLVIAASAQTLTGEIDGTVRDSAGAVVPDAVVLVTNTDQNIVQRTIKTNRAGGFAATQLAIGNYKVSVTRAGFKTSVTLVKVHVDQPSSLDLTLSLGSVSEVVTVTETSNAPETQTVAAQTLLEGNEIRELSLSSRNYQQLFLLQPGVSGDIPGTVDRGIISSSGSLNTAQFQVNGQQSTQNAYYLDGADIENHGGNGQSGVFPSIDSIQEMSFLRNSYGAQYAGIGGGIVLVQSKAGTTRFHGSAYGFFRTTPLNANNYFNNLVGIPRPVTRYNDFGFTIGGPLWIPHHGTSSNAKTYFFVSEEFLRSALSTQVTLTGIPTAQQRKGIFSAPVCLTYTTVAQTTCATSSSSVTAFNATAQAYLDDIISKTPLPNSPTDPQGYIFNPFTVNNENQTMVRIDHQFGNRLNVFFRYMNDPFNLLLPHGVTLAQGPAGVGDSRAFDGGSNYLGHVTLTLTPATVIEGGYALEQSYIRDTPTGLITHENSPGINPILPFTSTLDRVPTLTVGANYTSLGPQYGPPSRENQTFVNVTHTKGRHTIYFGGQIETYLGQGNNGGNNAGTFSVTNSPLPKGSTASVFEQSFAQFLVGNITTFTQLSNDINSGQSFNMYEAYLQDNFRVSPRITLNIGVRYTHDQPVQSRPYLSKNIPLSTFDISRFNATEAPTIDTGGLICTKSPCAGGKQPNPSYNPTNGIIAGGSSSPFGAAVGHTSHLNFAPRIGIAMDPFGNGSTAIRTGYGIFFVTNTPGIFSSQQSNNPPYVASVTVSRPNFGNPAAGVTPATPTPSVLFGTDPQLKIGYIQLFNLDVQQKLGRSGLLDIGYYGNHALHLMGLEELNQPLPGAYAQAGVIAAGSVNGTNSVLLNRVRPYPGYSSINYETPRFMSNYNSLQAMFTERLSGRSVFSANYTFSKALTNSPAQSGSAPQNIYNLDSEYGPTLYNRPNVFSARLVYDLPRFGRLGHLAQETIGGWELSLIGYAASGRSLTETTTSVDPAGIGLLTTTGVAGASNRPDAIANPNLRALHTQKQWYNVTASFTNVPKGQARTGNAPVGNIRGPGYEVADLALLKNFALPRDASFQLRIEAFNAPNHTNFNAVSTVLGATNQGQVTSAGQARVLQLAGKFSF